MSTCGSEERDVSVEVWESVQDDAIVVQIDTGEQSSRVRVNLNDGVLYDGDPEVDEAPGWRKPGLEPFDVVGALSIRPDIGEEVACHVLGLFGQGGYMPGSFTTHLLEALLRADMTNFRLLSVSYPEYAAAMILVKQHPEGIRILRSIAGIGPSPYSETREGTADGGR